MILKGSNGARIATIVFLSISIVLSLVNFDGDMDLIRIGDCEPHGPRGLAALGSSGVPPPGTTVAPCGCTSQAEGVAVLTQVAEGVLVHQSELIQNNTVVVQGEAGVLLIDPGITGEEMVCLANDLRELGQPVVAGFATHPDWDHVLWHGELGEAPRYGTARCAAFMQDLRSNPDWKTRVAEGLPPEIAEDTPLDWFGLITGLPAETTRIPWDGPHVRIIEHPAHAPGHAALLVEEPRVLAAGDMLSDVLIPMFDDTADPIENYLAGLRLIEDAAGDVDVVVPGHGSVGGADQLRARIDQDRAYVHALRDGHDPDDPRLGPSAKPGWEWVNDIHTGQLQRLAKD